MNKITILSFSGREHGNCRNISREIEHFHMRTNVLSYIIDTVFESDLVYFIVPNYCGYPCANYFAYNERTVGYFNMDSRKMQRYMDVPKKFILVSNSEGAVFEDAMRQQTEASPDILYLKSQKYRKQSIAGDLMTCEAARADLRAFLSRVDA